MLLDLLRTLESMHNQGVLHTAIVPLDIVVLKSSFKRVKLLNWRSAHWDVAHLLGHDCKTNSRTPAAYCRCWRAFF